MSDPKAAAEQAHERAARAGERAQMAKQRALDAKRRADEARRKQCPDLERAETAARAAEWREEQSKASARLAHAQGADLNEQRARDLAAIGDKAAAKRARTRADKAREREHH